MSQSQVNISQFENRLSRTNKLGRLLWNITAVFFFRPFILKCFNPWRIFILRCFGARLHSQSVVYSSVKIWAPWRLTMDAHSCLGPHVNCYNTGHVYIGHSTTISHGAYLCSGSHDITNPKFPMIPSGIYIDSQVWIATEAFIGPGVTIGEGAVVGARACVFKDVEPWTVVGGNPAGFIKKRTIEPTSA
jgi:putative colanic acid biosynthesis acetyltransferase WcaF